MSSAAEVTGNALALDRISVRRLGCLGSRCWMRTKAIPVSWGRAFRSRVNASSPPAEAPIPTTANASDRGSADSTSVTATGFGVLGGLGLAGEPRDRRFTLL